MLSDLESSQSLRQMLTGQSKSLRLSFDRSSPRIDRST